MKKSGTRWSEQLVSEAEEWKLNEEFELQRGWEVSRLEQGERCWKEVSKGKWEEDDEVG